jgi:type I restriction enzyme M protein
VAARIKQELVEGFNLHTIVRLPSGVFAPYTPIQTNVLFFDRSGRTERVWYYEHPLPEGRKNYSKTQPLRFDEFTPLLEWWGNRAETEHAWVVPAEKIIANRFNLDLRNPSAPEALQRLLPGQLADSIVEKERRILSLMEDVRKLLGQAGS